MIYFYYQVAHAKLVEDRESVKSQPSKPWSEVSQIVDRLSTPRSASNKEVQSANSPNKSMSLPRVKVSIYFADVTLVIEEV